MKRRYGLISDKQPRWKKEFFWKSLLKQIQDELPVKDVAEMVVDYSVGFAFFAYVIFIWKPETK